MSMSPKKYNTVLSDLTKTGNNADAITNSYLEVLTFDGNTKVVLPNGQEVDSLSGRLKKLDVRVSSENVYEGNESQKDINKRLCKLSTFDINGNSDETIKFLEACKYAIDNNYILNIDRNVNVIFSSIPNGNIVDNPTGTFLGKSIYIPNMIGDGKSIITLDGDFGLNTNKNIKTHIENITINVKNRKGNESSANSGWSNSGCVFIGTETKISSCYNNININVDCLPTERVKMGICELKSDNCQFINIQTVNIANVLWNRNGNMNVYDNITAKNFETVLWLQDIDSYTINNIKGINTKDNASWWLGKTTGIAANGKDIIMIEPYAKSTLPKYGSVKNIYSEWVIERSVYIIASDVYVDGVVSINGEGVKVVGANANLISKNNTIKNITVKLMEDYAIQSGRSSPYGFITYWSENTEVYDSFIDNIGSVTRSMTFLLVDGVTGANHSTKNIKLVRCGAKYTQDGLILIGMRNTEQSTDLDYIVLDGIEIIDCWTEKRNRSAMNGPLFEVTDLNRNDVIKSKYAVKNVKLLNCSLKISQTPMPQRDFAPYSFNYVDGFYSSGLIVDDIFSNGILWYNTPSLVHNNITLYDNFNFNTNNIRLQMTALGKVKLNKGSVLKFNYIDSSIANNVTYRGCLTVTYVETGQYAYNNNLTQNVLNLYLKDQSFNMTSSKMEFSLQIFNNIDIIMLKQVNNSFTSLLGTIPNYITANGTSLTIQDSSQIPKNITINFS